jgi:adenylate cyclase
MLTVRDGPQRGQVFPLKAVSTVGRSKSCTASVDDADASRTHLVIEFESNEYTVRDNGSANGTFLNGRRINVAALRHGDLLKMGGTTLLFQIGVSARVGEGHVDASFALDLNRPPFDAVNEQSGTRALAAALQKYKVLFQTHEILSRVPEDDAAFFKRVLTKLMEIMAFDRGLVLLGTSEEHVELAATVTRSEDVSAQPVSLTLLKRVLSGGEAVLVHDTLLDERLQDSSSQLSTGSRSLVCVPLRTVDVTFGAMQLESHHQEAAFDENDLQMVAALGRQIALSLSHAEIEKKRLEAVERARLRRFLSSADTERALKAPPGWRETRLRRVALLFVDLRPLTAELSRPEALKSMDAMADKLVDAVFNHRGAVGRLTADALLAFWGVPFPEPDDLRRAAEAALDIQALWAQSDLKLRAALHWCDAMTGEFGSAHRTDFAVIGPGVENCARFTARLNPGTVGASQAFYTELSTALEGEWGAEFRLNLSDEAHTRLFHVRSLKV